MMLRLLESYDQRITSSRLTIGPEPIELRYMHDVFGNCVGVARFDQPADRVCFDSRVSLEHSPAPLISDADEAIAPSGPTFPFAYNADDMPDLLRSIERHHPDRRASLRPGRGVSCAGTGRRRCCRCSQT